MTKKLHERWLGVAVALILGGVLSFACSSKSTEASGETHFVKCKTNADCAEAGASLSCQGGECRPAPNPDGGAACAPGCVPAYGFPNDDTRGCVDVSKREVLGCFCESDPNPSACRVRISDGTTWLGSITTLAHPNAFTECKPVGPIYLNRHACDFESCATPPPSWCNREDTCKSLSCGGVEFDSNGCARATCTTDADCGASERCVTIGGGGGCANSSACEYDQSGTCQCSGPLICAFATACNSTADYGPGGAWSALELDSGSGPCPPGMDCTSSYRLTPDGQLVMSKFGTPSTATVDATVFGFIKGIIDGPELRKDLRDGFQCGPPPTDVGWSIKLELPGGGMQSDVTGCILTGPDGNVAKQLYDYLKAY